MVDHNNIKTIVNNFNKNNKAGLLYRKTEKFEGEEEYCGAYDPTEIIGSDAANGGASCPANGSILLERYLNITGTTIANLTAGLILLHNHPSGEPEPSQEDIQITRRLCEVGKLIGIRVLDHHGRGPAPGGRGRGAQPRSVRALRLREDVYGAA